MVCKIEDKLYEIHRYTHTILDAMNRDELRHAHVLGCQILEMLNGEDATNGVQFIALFEALSVRVGELNF